MQKVKSAAPSQAVSTQSRADARSERKETTRLQLLTAAARIIGRYGYAGCTIARVTSRAKIAHGTFYLYFQSQQELFDAVLPTLGAEMLDTISRAVRESKDLLDLERRGFAANFAYLKKHPYMYRVSTEAELYAPTAYQKHIDSMVERYSRSLRRSLSAQHAHLSDREIEARVTILLGSRMSLLQRYGLEHRMIRQLPEDIIDIYLDVVKHGIGIMDRAEAPMSDGTA